MKPKPVRPLHRPIPGTQKNCRLPLIVQSQSRPSGCCEEPGRHGLPAAKLTSLGWNEALEFVLQVEIRSHFPLRYRSTAADPTLRGHHHSPHPQQPAEPRGLHPAPRSASPALGSSSSPMVAALILTMYTQGMSGISPDLLPWGKGPSRAKMLGGGSESVPRPLCPLRSRRDIVLVQPIRNTNH